ncbi:S28 family serine protease, partial [Legionella steelei]
MMFARKYTILFLSLWALSIAHAGMVERYMQEKQAENKSLVTEKTIQLAYFKQLIDHNDPAAGTFSQRYYIDESYGATDDSPVFFYICGEAACTKRALNGAIRNYAQKFHAKLVALEHRYYGESLPFNSLSTQNLRFLTTEAALDDLAYFQRHFKNEKNWNGKWVAFGGSYPGSLSAYYR